MHPATTEKEQQPTLTAADSFRFACHDAIPCFTHCCRDVNIYLTPYDVLRLRRALNMGSSEFLDKYTRHFLAGKNLIPVVQFDMDSDSLYCKLVTENGCRVYEDRPWACRMFPLDLGSVEGEYQMIAGKERCLGLTENAPWKVSEWLNTQGVEPYVEMERAFQAILPPPSGTSQTGMGKLLFIAYDLDRFAELLKDERFSKFHEVDEELLREALENEEVLLMLAFRYIRSQMEELYQM
jgi:uncharacterized protein